MKDTKYYLGLFFGKWDDKKDEPWIIYEASSQEELDKFTRQFESDKDLRKKYDQFIGECALEDMRKIKKNETKHNKFKGRISAFYYNEDGERTFVDVAYQKRIVVRDFRELKTVKEQLAFFNIVFDEVLKKIKYREKRERLSRNDKMYILISTIQKYGYNVSENERYYLAAYFNDDDDKQRKTFFAFMKQNLVACKKRMEEEKLIYHMDEEDLARIEEEVEEPEEEYVVYDADDVFFNEVFNKAIKENDFDMLFRYFTADEINSKSNFYKVNKGRGKKLCIK